MAHNANQPRSASKLYATRPISPRKCPRVLGAGTVRRLLFKAMEHGHDVFHIGAYRALSTGRASSGHR